MRPNLSKSKSPAKRPAEQVVKDIRRATRRHFSAEDKIRIVLDGLRGQDSIAELCRKDGIAQALYYGWSTAVREGGKTRLDGETVTDGPGPTERRDRGDRRVADPDR